MVATGFTSIPVKTSSKLPDISKLSGTLIDSVSKVDGVLKESIASIVGLTVPSGTAYTPPLDTYTGATAAYSVRKLSSTYSGSCIEAYRVSDGATQDIGFDAEGLIDTAAIATFASGGEVRVRTWYDQSGNALDAVQTTVSQMPQIYDGSAVNTENDTPAILWNGTNQTYLQTGLYDAWSDGSSFTTMVFNGRQGPSGSHTYWDIETGVQRYSSGAGNIFALFYGTSQVQVSTNIAPATQGIHTWYNVASETDAAVYIDGALKGTNTRTNPVGDTNVSAYIGSRIGGSQWNSCHYQEIIHWGSDVASTRTGLESNLNDYFQITNLPATSSGLLYDYPDAAAAYSVRSLSNNAIKCMRVRRTVSPFDEQDIGFDSNGDLDTAAIVTFGGSDPLTVSAWYDQSGQSRHATQVTASAQPQIYDGTAVITENGKPAVEFASDYIASAPFGADVPQPTTYFITVNKTNHSGYLFERVGTGGRQAQGDSTWVFAGSVANGFYPTSDLGSQRLFTALFDGASSISRMNSAATGSGNPGTDGQSGIQIGRPNQSLTGKVQEFVMYGADQTSNFTAIESNINTYFSIY